MSIPLSHTAKRARQAQLEIVPKESSSGARQRLRSSTPTGAESATRPLAVESEADNVVLLYRRTFDELADLIARGDIRDRLFFFYAMRFMQMLGLRSQDVVEHLEFSQENVCRWMSGQRCPHPEMRRYVLETCVAILRRHVRLKSPPQFALSE